MVDPTVARRTMSRYRLYLAGAVLIIVAVISYYFMNAAPNKLSKNSKSHLKYPKKTKLWNQNKFVSNSNFQSQKAEKTLYQGKLSKQLTDSHHPAEISQPSETAANNIPVTPFMKTQFSHDVNDALPMKTSRQGMKMKQNRFGVWRITNESRFYGPVSDYPDFFHGMKRLVHLDLKGAPPNKLYLQKLFPLFKTFGATGIILEYEDMFPYKGRFSAISARNCYTEEDVKDIIKYAALSELEIIPLIPTFGHLEFLLKHEQFRNLRDVDSSPLVITPALDATYVILSELIKQVMRLHNTSAYFHIGAGEVTNLGVGLSASLINKGKTRDDIVLDHVTKVGRIVKEKFNKQSIMWDDMLRSMDAKRLQESQLGQYVQPMVWSSMTDPAEKLTTDIWSKYRVIFKYIWVASSFKGSRGSGKVMTDAVYHLKNNLNWIRLIESVGPGARDQEQAVNIIGIGIIGRQRYNHFSTLCELLPAGLPSLAVSLKVMQLGGFNQPIHRLVSKQLQCEKPVRLELLKKYEDYDGCKFPGSVIYYKVRTLWGKLQTYAKVQEDINSFASEINYKHQFFSPDLLKGINSTLMMLNTSIGSMDKFMKHEIGTYFDSMTANEWVEINIRQVVQEITQEVQEIAEFSKRKTWSSRPGYETRATVNTKDGELNTGKRVVIKAGPDQDAKRKEYLQKLSPLQQLMKIRRRFNQTNLQQMALASARLREIANTQKQISETNLKPGIGKVSVKKVEIDTERKTMGQKPSVEINNVDRKKAATSTEEQILRKEQRSGMRMYDGQWKKDKTERQWPEKVVEPGKGTGNQQFVDVSSAKKNMPEMGFKSGNVMDKKRTPKSMQNQPLGLLKDRNLDRFQSSNIVQH
ncbi:hexosaminidase D-like [Ylistrum balloti]|uniref:hexosaminidase D-like n=1 Tax=Ylistrum balloti TaxID=509963 RepID=UPI002905EDE8|nr:hexosaminidase D-like [Ylistrum balloti]